ncbi:DUF6074 family protein [Aquibium oceanicum]|uniref:Uncharacterized protein n=1 Tax=Aquibium oceanicum TaxID=1670800 RepID=A0A1L3SVV8_9HYPH|nr:DUF6074 family protein [Aquibium oceanicum]APH73566.1 hypothetical protein BSQ44_20950 [Aquibium oceanicum]
MSVELNVVETETVECRINVFPLWRRTAEVRRAATTLAVIADTDDADDFRHALARQYFAELADFGLSEDEQDELVGAFFHQVELELEVMFLEASETVG